MREAISTGGESMLEISQPWRVCDRVAGMARCFEDTLPMADILFTVVTIVSFVALAAFVYACGRV